jgi:hypothetical protein
MAAWSSSGAAVSFPGVFRFSSFQEADAWMTKMMIAAQMRRERARRQKK